MTDLGIQQDILDLAFEPSIDAAHIGVSVENGIATLSGHVPTYAEKADGGGRCSADERRPGGGCGD